MYSNAKVVSSTLTWDIHIFLDFFLEGPHTRVPGERRCPTQTYSNVDVRCQAFFFVPRLALLWWRIQFYGNISDFVIDLSSSSSRCTTATCTTSHNGLQRRPSPDDLHIHLCSYLVVQLDLAVLSRFCPGIIPPITTDHLRIQLSRELERDALFSLTIIGRPSLQESLS